MSSRLRIVFSDGSPWPKEKRCQCPIFIERFPPPTDSACSMDDLFQGPGHGRGGIFTEPSPAAAAVFGDLRVHGNGTEERNVHVLRDALAPTRRQDLGEFAALGADRTAHVVNDSMERH